MASGGRAGLRWAWGMSMRWRCRAAPAGAPQRRGLSHGASVESAHRKQLLVRDFVFHSLYAPGVGYFQDKDVVGSVRGSSEPASHPDSANAHDGKEARRDTRAGRVEQATQSASQGLDFNGMLGEMEYRNTVAQLYGQGGSAWMTPCELFHPWYARAVARFVVEQLRARQSPSAAPASSRSTTKKQRALKLRVFEVCTCGQMEQEHAWMPRTRTWVCGTLACAYAHTRVCWHISNRAQQCIHARDCRCMRTDIHI